MTHTKSREVKKIDFFEIKKALKDQPSANLELIIQDCAYLIRSKAVAEYIEMMQQATSDKLDEISRKI